MSSTQPADNTFIRDRLTTLEDEIVKLRDRLETALAPSPPSTETTAVKSSSRSHIAGRLESLIDNVRDLTARLEI
jgi:hypothetical protein